MQTLLLSLILLADPTPGVRPLGADGKPLNLDFETGTLANWKAEGTAFERQPIQGDTVQARRNDMASHHQGQYWVGSFEKLGDKATGTLTSDAFKVTHPWGSFLVGGGSHPNTCVEILTAKDNKAFFKATGQDNETMSRVAVDLSKHQGQEIRIRLTDKNTGGWGHINFDDFLFHSEKPAVAQAPVSLSPDDYKYAGQTPTDAARNMTVPPGFSVSLFAGEPDVHQPIAMCFDDRGRLWVIEAYCYPKRHPSKGPLLPVNERKNGDKILIFEDTDGDGKFDKKITFMEGLNLASGIEYGFRGIWVGAAPYLLYIPIDATGDKPDGEPQIMLDGWGYEDTHETLNSFIWGPDGWLYGCHGVFTHSKVGKPGTPADKRVPINAGVWRYHPKKHTFEVFAHGISNPWGLDYNKKGDFFVEACVIPHLWHVVSNARYQRQAGPHFNPYTYDDIKTIANHRHYLGATPHGGNGKSDSAGGGHAHSGLLCYQGDAWPKEYQGKLLMGNIHGHRINVDVIQEQGASYVGDRNPDFLLSHDKHCIIVSIKQGPDGNVYFSDWSDKQVCHRNDPEIWDRTNGRIFKISHQNVKPLKPFDLSKSSHNELLAYQSGTNEWFARTARRIMHERAGYKGNLDFWTTGRMNKADDLALNNPDEYARLRGLWLFEIHDHLEKDRKEKWLADASPVVRAGAVRAYLEKYKNGDLLKPTAAELAEKDPSPMVRRELASALPLLKVEQRWPILKALVTHVEDAKDHVLPYLYWYALEPLCAIDPAQALQLAAESKLPTLLPFAARRIGVLGTPEAISILLEQAKNTKEPAIQLFYLNGLRETYLGKRNVEAPKGWAETLAKFSTSESAPVRQAALALGATFGDEKAFAQLRNLLADTKADTVLRQSALASLLTAKDAKLPAVLQGLLEENALRLSAIRGLATFDEPGTATVILTKYKMLNVEEKRAAVATLASRKTTAMSLLNALEVNTIPMADVPAETIRQLRNLNDENLNKKIAMVWGVVRDTPADRKKLIADWAKKLNAASLANADLTHGRAVFAKVCAQCHTLYGVGAKVGPDITGANRADLNYLLENIFDPSAVIPKEYAATKLVLADGRIVTGIVKEETASTITMVTATETQTYALKDIEKKAPSDQSMMPDDLTKPLTEIEVRALFAYLKNNGQVPIKANDENAKEFFNGKDLSNWDGDKTLWTVENGELVGKSATGLKKNNFLTSQLEVTDFKLTVKVKLTPNKENSGIQFRSIRIDDGEMRGAQADIGAGWWGKLYEESARGLLWKEPGDKHVKENDWNEYTIEARGSKVKTWVNGNLCVNLDDDKLAKKGLIGVQLHSGGPIEVRFKDVKLEVLK